MAHLQVAMGKQGLDLFRQADQAQQVGNGRARLADRFRDLAVRRPGLVEQVSAVVSARRQGLAQAQAAADEARGAVAAPQSLLSRIKAFLNL